MLDTCPRICVGTDVSPHLGSHGEGCLSACVQSAPFHTLAFLGLPVVIGKLKICSLGLIDVWANEVVPLEEPLAAAV